MNVKFPYYFFAISVLVLMFAIFPQTGAQSTEPPDGSYKNTCKDIDIIMGNVLSALCKNKSGGYVRSALKYEECEGDISNDNGRLNCKKKPGPKPPSGSYQKSCKNIKVDGNKLWAKCETRGGSWNKTNINYKKCKGDISNNNGELSCGGQGGKIPKGSYRDSCKNSYVEGSTLYSNCKKKNGGWNKTSMNYRNCNKDINNDNGKLVCGGGSHSGYPKGSYKKSCKNLYMEGNVLEADCKNDNGKWKHSSIKYKNCNKGIWNDNGRLRCN